MSTDSATPDDRGRQPVSISCLGRLGRWGNQILQYAFIKIYAELNGLVAECPEWPGRHFLAEAARDPPITAEDRPLAADRPVLSHRGWKAWATTREPLRSAWEANGRKPLSGRQVRRLVPQVNGDSLRVASPPAAATTATTHSAPPPPPPSPAPLAGHDFWGWFMFSTDAYAPHRARFRELLRLQPGPAAALEAAVRSAAGPACCTGGGEYDLTWDVVAVHLRLGEGYTAVEEWEARRREGRGGGGGAAAAAAGAGPSSAAAPDARCGRAAAESSAGVDESRDGDPRRLAPASADDEEAATADQGRSRCDGAPAVAPPGGVGLGVESSTTGEWDDTGVFWHAPIEWYTAWLRENIGEATASAAAGPLSGGSADAPSPAESPSKKTRTDPPPQRLQRRVVVFSDRPAEAREALRAFGAQSPAEALGEGAYSALVQAFGGGADGEALADFYLLSRCSVLLVSNSSFSFCAAMLATATAVADTAGEGGASSGSHSSSAPPACGGGRCRGVTTVRPDPQQRKVVPFDPWSASPTLKLG